MARKHCASASLTRYFKQKLDLKITKSFMSLKELREMLIIHHPDILTNLGINSEFSLTLEDVEKIVDSLGLIVRARKPRLKMRSGVILSGEEDLDYFKTKAFLTSHDWAEVRYKVLLKYGARCMCCGRSAKDNIVINVDHIKPRSTHPQLALDINNLQVLCDQCNKGKGSKDTTDWRSA